MGKKNLFLIGIVVLLWGVIGFRVAKSLGTESDLPKVMSRPPLTVTETAHDSLRLHLDYPDPFLHGLTGKPKPQNAQRVIRKTVEITKPQVEWNAIQYIGTVSNPNRQVHSVMIRYKGQDLLLFVNDEFGDFKIEKILKDSVLVNCRKELKFLKSGNINQETIISDEQK